jgi:hypothetical protein
MVFPPGYRFFPTEEELISFYLHHKLDGGSEDLNQVINQIIPVRDIYEHDPWDLPRKRSLLSVWVSFIYLFIFSFSPHLSVLDIVFAELGMKGSDLWEMV